MNVFTSAPEFIECDNRRARTYSPISAEQMANKHEALLPRDIVRGKTVLDLGCGIGATGHWCLSMGATHYSGVEAQSGYASTARDLLQKHHPGKATVIESSFDAYLAASDELFDVVSILAVLHASVDMYGNLKALCARAREVVAIEELVPRRSTVDSEFSGIEFSSRERTNMADTEASLEGRGARISPAGLAFVMQDFGFESSGVLRPRPITDIVDNFNAPQTPGNARYLMRFVRTHARTHSVAHDLVSGARDNVRSWSA